jgi:high-affinity iron transporter
VLLGLVSSIFWCIIFTIISTCLASECSPTIFANHPPVYTAGRNSFEAAENIWEGVFGIVASIIITLMGAALLRVSKLQDKWRVKISKVLESKDSKLPVKGRVKRWMEKYAMFILPFVTVLREGIEAVL